MILNYSGWGVQCIGFIARFITIVTHSLGNVLSNVIVYFSVLPLLFLLILLPLFSQRSTASSTVLVNASGKLSYNLSHCLSARICPSISYTESISMVCLPAKGNEGCYLVNDIICEKGNTPEALIRFHIASKKIRHLACCMKLCYELQLLIKTCL